MYYCNRLVYEKHVFLHHLIIPLLDLIQSPYHGIVITLVAKGPLHVHQQVPHRDVFALVQCAGPFTRVPMKTGEDVGCILASSYCSRKASASKCQSVYVTSTHGSVDLKIGISNLAGANRFLSLLPLRLCQWPAISLTASVRVWHSPVWGGRGQTPSANCSALGLQWPPTWSHCSSAGDESCLSLFLHPRGSPILLRCTPHQLAREVGLACRSNWWIMGRVLGSTYEPSAVGGSNRLPPHLHQREEAHIEVGRA